MKVFNLLLAGVGGQGILLAAEALGTAAIREGLNVRVSEIHGAAQRGGSVVSNIRIGEGALAPTMVEGTADVILGLEPLETLRNIRFASEKTLVVMNSQIIVPPGIYLKGEEASIPSLEKVLEKIRLFTRNVIVVDALKLAKDAGSAVAQNIVLVGALAATEKLPIKTETLKSVVEELVPAKYLEVNRKAFELGYNYVKSIR
ncbi:hypothetical protein DRO50_00545 [Candidatus Bathyarchaeota archaeon]|nr:MAG: hypothetical protein DRO50_00545 [Candidatus Bathyarchaeota archaeon]